MKPYVYKDNQLEIHYNDGYILHKGRFMCSGTKLIPQECMEMAKLQALRNLSTRIGKSDFIMSAEGNLNTRDTAYRASLKESLEQVTKSYDMSNFTITDEKYDESSKTAIASLRYDVANLDQNILEVYEKSKAADAAEQEYQSLDEIPQDTLTKYGLSKDTKRLIIPVQGAGSNPKMPLLTDIVDRQGNIAIDAEMQLKKMGVKPEYYRASRETLKLLGVEDKVVAGNFSFDPRTGRVKMDRPKGRFWQIAAKLLPIAFALI